MRSFFAIILFVVSISTATAQGRAKIDVDVRSVLAISGADKIDTVGGLVVVPADADLQLSEAAVIVVDSDASDLDLIVEDSNGDFADFEIVDESTFVISKPGKYKVTVEAIDWEKRLRGKKRMTVVVKSGGGSIGGGVDIPEPSDELKNAVKAIGEKLASDSEKASLVASVFAGIATAVEGKAGKRLNTVEQWDRVTADVLFDLQANRGVSIGAEVAEAIKQQVKLQTLDDGIEDRVLNDDDRSRIAELFRAIAWSASNNG